METYIIKERIAASSDAAAKREAIASRNTVAVAAIATAGAKVLEYARVIEGQHNVVTFAVEEKFLKFRPDFAAEDITVGEMVRRMNDAEWLRTHPEHPITYMAYALESYKRLTRAMRDNSPMVCIERGRQKLFLNVRGDRDYQRRLMVAAKIPEGEIEAILGQLEAMA